MDYVHGGGSLEYEFYVPGYNLTFNIANNTLNSHFGKRITGNQKIVAISDTILNDIYNFTSKKGKIDELIPEIRSYFNPNNNVDGIGAFIYERKVYEDVMDYVHGGGQQIKEIYVPEYGFAVNVGNGVVNVYKTGIDAEFPTPIKIDKKLAHTLNIHCEQKENLKQYVDLIEISLKK